MPPRAASAVAAGILGSRLAGFVRDRALAHYFGLGPHQDVFGTALRGPNLLQNLLGEQALSSSFIPIYARLLREGKREEAGRFAGAIFGLLLALVAALSLAGVLLARPIVAFFAAGFLRDAAKVAAGELTVDRFPLAVAAVRWMFPMTGLLVLSAWALGVLNSHRRFLLPYLAPVVWNAAMIGAVVWVGQQVGAGGAGSLVALDRLLIAACAGALVGGALQFAVQLPAVAHEMRGFRLSFGRKDARVREALRAFGPAVGGRGVLQLSSYLDQLLASLLAPGAVAALRFGQQLYLLPISLFAMSVAAASLPDLSGEPAEDGASMAGRLAANLRQVAFFVLPATAAYLAFGELLVGGIYRTGSFGGRDVFLVSLVLAVYSLGLPAGAMARQLQVGYYARGDTRRPAIIAAGRVALGVAVAVPAMLWLDRIGVGDATPLRLGAVGLAAGSTAGSWWELGRLWRGLKRTYPMLAMPWRALGRCAALSVLAVLPAMGVARLLPESVPEMVRAAAVAGLFGVTYVGSALLLGVPEAEVLRRRMHLRRG